MKNARVAALIYEILNIFYCKMDIDQGRFAPDFFHNFTSAYEWLAGCLADTGVLRPTRTGGMPLLTLEEARARDFREFESFDNYCYFMFTYWQIFCQQGTNHRSPYFLEDIAEKDDVFVIDNGRVFFDEARFNEKVMTRWRELDVREIRRIL